MRTIVSTEAIVQYVIVDKSSEWTVRYYRKRMRAQSRCCIVPDQPAFHFPAIRGWDDAAAQAGINKTRRA